MYSVINQLLIQFTMMLNINVYVWFEELVSLNQFAVAALIVYYFCQKLSLKKDALFNKILEYLDYDSVNDTFKEKSK